MVWNYHEDDVPAPPSEVTVTISGVPSGVRRVLLEHFRIDGEHSNAFTAWQQMGSPQNPTPEQYAHLQAAGALQTLTSPEWMDVSSDGKFTITTRMPRAATSLLHLSW